MSSNSYTQKLLWKTLKQNKTRQDIIYNSRADVKYKKCIENIYSGNTSSVLLPELSSPPLWVEKGSGCGGGEREENEKWKENLLQ